MLRKLGSSRALTCLRKKLKSLVFQNVVIGYRIYPGWNSRTLKTCHAEMTF